VDHEKVLLSSLDLLPDAPHLVARALPSSSHSRLRRRPTSCRNARSKP
jgi:hypothetical protein